MRKTYISLLILLFFYVFSFAQTPITGITVSTKTATPSSYSSGGNLYEWGNGNDIYLDSVEISGTSYVIGANIYDKNIQLQRVDNANSTGERCRIFVERITNTEYEATYPVDENGDCSMITALSEPILNRGALDVFQNQDNGTEHANNIERVDVLTTGLVVPATALLDELGFLATEKQGNNDYQAAAILSMDEFGNPASYGNLVYINGGSPNSYGLLGSTYSWAFLENDATPPHEFPERYRNASEQTGFTLVTFQDLGLSQGQVIYGISFFEEDVNTTDHTLTNPSTFPRNSTGGADMQGGLGSIFHTSSINILDMIDTDGDGVADIGDLDDDNDGILDTNEGCGNDTDISGTVDFGSISDSDDGAYSITGTTVTYDFMEDGTSITTLNLNGTNEIGPIFKFNGDEDDEGSIDASFSPSIYSPVFKVTDFDQREMITVDVYDGNGNLLNLTDRKYIVSVGTQISQSGNVFTEIDSNSDVDGDESDDDDRGSVLFNFLGIAVSRIELSIHHQEGSSIRITQIAYCSGDTDVDGTPNYLDVDSDGDGCADAVEGAGSFTNSSIDDNAMLTGGEDGNGVPTAATGSGQANHADVTDASTQSSDCNECTSPLYTDTDNDGVNDICDLDDDNDGIPDTEEMMCGAADWTTNGYTAGATDYQPSILGVGTVGSASVDFIGVEVGTPNYEFLYIDNAIGGNGTEGLEFRGSSVTSETDAMDWTIDFSTTAYNVELYYGGVDGKDRVTVTAFYQGNPIDLGTDNFSNYPNLTYTSPNIMDGPNDPVANHNSFAEAFYFSLAGPVDSFIFKSFQGDGTPATVTSFISDFKYCISVDTDNDGIANHLDLDSDNDGIPDLVEAGGTDSDGDGLVDVATDTDGDGLVDTYDNDDTDGPDVSSCSIGVDCDLSGSTSLLFDTDADGSNDNDRDSDSDSYPNYIDIDADNDGIVDNTEAQGTSSYVSPSGNDTDEDGLDDAYDTDCTPCGAVAGRAISPINTGGNSNPDYLDSDSDGDGEADILEGHDTNNDGVVDGSDSPLAGTGLSGGSTDVDGDGLLDGFDNNIITFDATNGSLEGNSHPDTGGPSTERDWREDLALPVEWLDFRLSQKQGNAILDWATATEINADYYGIERSINGTVFQEIGQEKATGTTTEISEYLFIDDNLNKLPSGQVFYRLRQVDLDGAFEYSKILELSLEDNSELWANVMPNPVVDWMTIQYKLVQVPSVELYILNSLGQQIYSKSINDPAGEFKILAETWADGIYYVRFQGENSREIFKVQVQH